MLASRCHHCPRSGPAGAVDVLLMPVLKRDARATCCSSDSRLGGREATASPEPLLLAPLLLVSPGEPPKRPAKAACRSCESRLGGFVLVTVEVTPSLSPQKMAPMLLMRLRSSLRGVIFSGRIAMAVGSDPLSPSAECSGKSESRDAWCVALPRGPCDLPVKGAPLPRLSCWRTCTTELTPVRPEETRVVASGAGRGVAAGREPEAGWRASWC